MKLRNKILLVIGFVWILFFILTYTGSNLFLIRSFLTLEQSRTNNDLARVDQALDQINYSLYTFTSDWSHWNDLYDYAQGKNAAFVPNNLNMTAYINSTINLITFWDKEGHLFVGTAVDTDKKQLVAYQKGLEKYIYPGSIVLDSKDVNKELRGYMLVDDGIMMVTSTTITDGDKLQPPLGVMVTGRFLSPKIIQKIEDTTKLNLELFVLNQIEKNAALKNAFQSAIHSESGHESKPIDQKNLEGFTVIKDIFNKPIGMFRMVAPRAIYGTGKVAINYYLAAFVALGILFSMLMIWLLRALIIKRLERLDHEVADISAKNALKQRVNASGNDELSSVSSQINAMMDIIQASHEQLEQRVEERTQELKSTNIQLQDEITERKSVEKELIIHKEHLVRLAHYDNLTSLPNRVFFNEILNKALSHAARHKKSLAILFVDLDRFKTINDALGHPTGDLVLKEIATRFATVLRAGDILARLGGDEFIILLNDITNPNSAGPVAEKLLHVCSQPVQIRAHEFFITASIGICIYPNDGASLEDLQKNADMAMYKAKRSGGGNYQYFTQEMNLEAHEHMRLESALRKAIINKEFVLHYQPKLNLADGKIMGVEALIRWESPEHGLISPAKFIPLAEETGLIMPIGEWALREACRACQSWQEQGYEPIVMAVNLSPKQFRLQDIAQLVATVLKDTKLPAKYLELEITETAVMDNVESAISRLREIQSMGIDISVDDFGTGYTSISYLKQFPVKVLKIDQSFIKGIPSNQNDIAITSAVIALAHNLGMKVVAEGVETVEQLNYLANHDCDMIQGYFISRPLPEKKIVLQFTKQGNMTEKSFV